MNLDGVEAPEQVPEGTTTPIEIKASGLDELVVHNSRTGKEIKVVLDSSGTGQFELPAGTLDGDVLTVVDPNDLFTSAIIVITPASI